MKAIVPIPPSGCGCGPFDAVMVLVRGRCLLLIGSGVVLAVAGLMLLPLSRLRRACGAVGALLGPFGGSAPITATVARRDRHPDQLLDVAQKGPLLGIAERDRDPVGAGAGGAADAVHVALRNVRQIVVDDVADALDVDAARGDVGGHQRAHASGAERRQHALALVLRLVAVDRLGGEPCLGERADHLVGAVLGAGEHQHAFDRLLSQNLRQQRWLAGAVDVQDAAARRARRWSPPGSPRPAPDHCSMWLASSAISRGMVAEKNSVWRLLGSFATILRMSWMKPMSSMRSASSSTKTSTRSRCTARCCMRSSSRPGVATRTSTPAASARIWRVERDAADGERDARTQVASVGLEAFDDLRGKLAGRAQHQHAAAASASGRRPVFGEMIEDRQREGRGLAGSGLRDADDVARGEHLRNGLGLDRGRGGVLLVGERAGDGFGKSEIEKGGQCGIFRMARPGRERPRRAGKWTPRVVWAVNECDAG